MRPFASLVLVIVIAASCGGGGAPPAAATTSTPPPAGPTPSPTAPPGALRFVIVTEGSKAVVRVDEKLAINPGRTDAVLNAIHCLEGDLVLLDGGAFWDGPKITMDMRRLQSDSAFRDTWVELFGPQTGRFPKRPATHDLRVLVLRAPWQIRKHRTRHRRHDIVTRT